MINFQAIHWEVLTKTEHKGETGTSFWKTLEFAGLRIRIVEFSSGYLADHCAAKGISYTW
jgi:hypothetical protein